jgi:hypothetical protein
VLATVSRWFSGEVDQPAKPRRRASVEANSPVRQGRAGRAGDFGAGQSTISVITVTSPNAIDSPRLTQRHRSAEAVNPKPQDAEDR